MRVFSVPMILALAVLVNHSLAGHIPIAGCTVFASLFKQMGCVETESALCRFLAIAFTEDFNGQQLCDNFICGEGYGQQADGHACKQLNQCLFTKWRPQGLCSGGNICCAP